MRYCEEYVALLNAFVDGECTKAESDQVQEHLKDCSGCRAYLQELMWMKDAFPGEDDIPVPDGFAEGVMAAVRAHAAPRKDGKRRWMKVVLSLAACLAILIAVREVWPLAQRSNTSSNETLVTAAVEAGAEEEDQEENASMTAQDAQENPAPDTTAIPAPANVEGKAAPNQATVPEAEIAAGDGQWSSSKTSQDPAPRIGIATKDTAYRRWATVTLSKKQVETLLADDTGVQQDGFTTYELTEIQFTKRLSALKDAGITFSEMEDNTLEGKELCCLYVYPADESN